MVRINIWKKLEDSKERMQKYRDKAATTRAHAARLADMQVWLDQRPEKINKIIEILNSKASDCDKLIKEKGVVCFCRHIKIGEMLYDILTEQGFDCYLLNSKATRNAKKRKNVCDNFSENPYNKIVIISEAGGESVNLQKTNELFLVDVPRGPGKWSQIIGRICRLGSAYESFNVHFFTILDTLDEFAKILLSAKKEIEELILHADTIPFNQEKSFDQKTLKEIRKKLLWKYKQLQKLRKAQKVD